MQEQEKVQKPPESEITSAQVIFPDRRTADDVYADMMAIINGMKSTIESLGARVGTLEGG